MDNSHVARRVLSPADRCSALIGCALLTIPLVYLWTDLTYDEAVYLRLARTIAESGLPLRRVYEDFTQFRLFGNSPPLVLYVASISQKVFPGNEVSARLVQFFAFALPTYAFVWWVVRSRFGAWAACASLVALLTTGSYVRDTVHVLLNIPLGLLACLTLLAFHQSASLPLGRRSWLIVLALAMALAVWTKYQSLCIAAAILVYVAYLGATRRYIGLRSVLIPLATTVASGGVAVIALFAFFWIFGGHDAPSTLLAVNAGRISPVSMSLSEIAAALVTTARECESTLGGVLLLFGALAMCAEFPHRGLLVLFGSYVVGTIAFNLAFFRLPGAGSSYLDSAIPALTLLAGPAAVRFVQLGSTPLMRVLLAAGATAIHLADSPSLDYEWPRPNGSRAAAQYILAHSPPTAGVLAETVAIEFYSNRPVRAVSFTYPKEILLRSVAGTSGDDISYVVVDARTPPKNLDSIRDQWNALLSEHFELVPVDAGSLNVYRRRTR